MVFLIDYNVVLKSGTIYNKQIKVKNKDSELIAKCSLENYLRRKYGDDFIKLIITNCIIDGSDIFNFIFRGIW